jgi:hypothetical protein
MITDVEFFFEQSEGSEILAEATEFDFRQLPAPEFIVLGRIGIDRFARPAVDVRSA